MYYSLVWASVAWLACVGGLTLLLFQVSLPKSTSLDVSTIASHWTVGYTRAAQPQGSNGASVGQDQPELERVAEQAVAAHEHTTKGQGSDPDRG